MVIREERLESRCNRGRNSFVDQERKSSGQRTLVCMLKYADFYKRARIENEGRREEKERDREGEREVDHKGCGWLNFIPG